MQLATKRIIGETGILALLNTILYQPMLVLCWKLLDTYEINLHYLPVLACVVLLIEIGIIVSPPIKSTYIKVILAYPGFLLFACILGIWIISGFWSA